MSRLVNDVPRWRRARDRSAWWRTRTCRRSSAPRGRCRATALRRAQAVRIEADAGAGASGPGAAVAQVQRDGAIHVARLHPHRRPQRAALVSQLAPCRRFPTAFSAVRRRRAHDRGVVPGQLGDGLGQFLQPAVVGEAAVVDRGIGPEDHFQFAASASGLRGAAVMSLAVNRRRLGGQRRVRHHAIVHRAPPPGFEIRARVLARPVAFDDFVRAACPARRSASAELRLRRAAVVERLDQRLLDGDRAIEGARVAPGFQVMRLRQVPLADFGSLVLVQAQVRAQRGPFGCGRAMPSSTGALKTGLPPRISSRSTAPASRSFTRS